MKKANELRIGNLIGCDGNILIVEKIDKQNNVGCSLFEKSKGQHVNSGNKYFIPLTKEWLLDFGFKLISEDKKVYCKGRFQIEKIGDSFIETRYGTNLKYIHKLQNLHFEIIKEELTLKTT